MLEKTSRKERLLAGAAGTTLALALAVSIGALPGAGVDKSDSVTVSSRVEQVTAAPVVLMEPPPAAVPPPVVEAAGPPPVPAVPKTAASKAPPSPTQARTAATAAKPPARAVAAQAPAAAVRTAVVPAPPVAPVLAAVPRRTPSSTEVKETIAELRSRVGGVLRFVSPTATQLHQAGDQVCTGFDNGSTFEQVVSSGLSSIPSSVKVSPENADWAVRKLVTLYCPGHAAKLS